MMGERRRESAQIRVQARSHTHTHTRVSPPQNTTFRFTDCCATCEICKWSFTMPCDRREISRLRFTKRASVTKSTLHKGHKKLHLTRHYALRPPQDLYFRRAKRCACCDIWPRFTNCCACHEICISRCAMWLPRRFTKALRLP